MLIISIMTSVLRHANTGVSIQDLRCFLCDCAKTADAPHVVSVGSGTGCYEFEMTDGLDDLRARLILVDPHPDSFRQFAKSTRELAPHAATTAELVAARPGVVGHCVVVLLWPSPHAETAYDLTAIDELKPLGIIILYDKPIHASAAAAAGSPGLHARLLHEPAQMDYKRIVEARYRALYEEDDYQLMLMFDANASRKRDIRLAWFAKRGASIPRYRLSEAVKERMEKRGLWKD